MALNDDTIDPNDNTTGMDDELERDDVRTDATGLDDDELVDTDRDMI